MSRVMKDSTLHWVGSIPDLWDTLKLKYLGTLASSGVDKKTYEGESLYRSVHYMDVYNSSMSELGNRDTYLIVSANSNKADNCNLKKGDVLFTNSSETPDDIGHSAIISEDLENTLYGYHLMRFRPEVELVTNFSKYMFGSYYVRSWFSYRAYGMTRYGLSRIDFSDLELIIPPVTEQIKISTYLDSKCATIDRLISLQEEMIAELQAYKQSVITEAVTKGLDPDVPMKDSGVEWIGDTPMQWFSVKLKYLCSMNSGTNLTSEVITETGLYPVYGGNDIRGYYKSYNFDGECLLVGRQGALCGNVIHVNGQIWATEHAVITQTTELMQIRYLYYLLIALNLNQYSISSAQPGLSVGFIKNLFVFTPKLKEQSSICNYLDKRIYLINEQIKIKQSKIDTLKEYKKSLIYECVTGKREVV